MTTILAEVLEKIIYKDIQSSDFLGVICDESCDTANFKQLIIYFMYIKNGVSKTSFVSIIDIDDGKADTIIDAILIIIDKLNININNIVGIGTDGAAVMTGCKNGVAAKLKNSGATHLIPIHCAAHRVSLALSQASRNITFIKEIELTLSQLYHFFDDSPVRESVLRLINEINENSDIKLKEPKQIRWLSFYEAIDAVLRSFTSIVQSLEHIAEKANDVNSVKAGGLLKKIKSVRFPYLLSIILDIIEPVKKLSKIFQYQNVLFTKIEPIVISCIDTISDLKLNKGDHESNFLKDFSNEGGNNFSYKGVKLAEAHTFSAIHDIKVQFIEAVKNNLQSRFPSGTLNVLKALNVILNPKSYPEVKNYLNDYGNNELEIIIAKYGVGTSPLIHPEILKIDFKHFKQITFNFRSYEMKDYLTKLITEYSDDFPEFVKLAKIASVLPISSADAERGFSCMKRIKTNHRSSMKEEKLTHLMMVSLEGPPLAEAQNIIDAANAIFLKKSHSGGLKQ